MRLGQWIIVLILIGLYGLASAEFYRYLDEEGKVKYTDDLGSVPVEQRPKADEYEVPYYPQEGIETEEPETESPQEVMKETEEVRSKREAPAKEVEEKTQEQKLREAGDRLREEYQALMKEKGELEKLAASQLTDVERKELIKRVRDYNLRSEDYENRRGAFNKEVEAYNVSIEKEVQEPR